MSKRRRRDERRPGVRVVLGARDEALLRGIARFRVATTTQLLRLFFRGIRNDTAAVRLRRLFDADMLDIARSALNAENVYALGAAGRQWLAARGVPYGVPPHGPLDHQLGIVEAWVGLAAGLRGSRSVQLSRFTPDWECRRQLAGTGALVVPDANVALFLGADTREPRQVRFVLEVDLGTERHGALRGKLVAYAAERLERSVGLVVLLAGGGDRRLAAVCGLIEEHWPSWSLACRLGEWPDSLLTRLAERPPTPLGASPNAKGSPDAATPWGATRSESQGEEPSR